MNQDKLSAYENETPGNPDNRLKVLVIDDEPDLADTSAALLRHHGFDSTAVYSAAEALDILKSHSDIDAIFSDVLMPDMDGLELAESVAILYPAIKVVLTSGFTKPDFWNKQTRPFRFASKPYSIDKVITLLTA